MCMRKWFVAAGLLSSMSLCVAVRAADELEPGLVGEYIPAPGEANDFLKADSTLKPAYVRIDKAINFDNVDGDFYGARMASNFHVRWTGVLKVEKDGKYEFATQSDDGSRVYVDDKLVVENGGVHPSTLKTGTIELKTGEHKLRVDFFQGGGGAEVILGWTVPGGKRQTIPAKNLFHVKGSEKIDFDQVAWDKRPKGMSQIDGKGQIGAGGGGAAAKGNPIHEKMDYGPFLSGTIESSYPSGGNFAIKGLAIRLGDKKQASVSFDTELIRYSVGWTGEYLKLDYGRDGLEGHPTPRGTPKFGTKGDSLGWANDGKWDDPRAKTTGGRKEGPLPKDWAKYKGIYLDGRNVVLHYTVGDCDILEQPSFDDSDGIDVFSRTFKMGKSAKPLTMLLVEDDKALASSTADAKSAALDLKDALIVAGIHGAPAGTTFAIEGKRVLVKFPASNAESTFTIKLANIKKEEKDSFAKLVDSKLPEVNFDVVTKGGAPRWKPIQTTGELAKNEDAPYVVDTVTIPYQNEYDAYMRLTGVDFFKDGRAAVCTMSGDVWIVSGIDKDLKNLTWRRYATGLFASLGVKVVDDVVYTTGRDQITRFHDLNNDGEADYYESFNNDCTVGPDYHEFAHDLHTDSKGNFYYMKGSNLSGQGGINHGTMVTVGKDGTSSSVYCVGFRAPNGMCVGPDDVITTGDNQGNWTPSSPINYIKKGGFYGFQLDSYPDTKKGPRLNPLCWVPYDEDNSCGGQVWGGPNWGPLSNRLLHMSYGKCKLFSVIIEKYNDDVQGGVVKFPLDFISGIMRARVNPVDGQVYVAGMRGWQTAGVKDGALQRVRYTGKPYNAPLEVKTANNGASITFSNALDKETTEDVSNWDVRRFNIKYTGAYGSDEYSVDDDTKKHGCGNRAQRDPVEIKSIKLEADGKTVKLELGSMKLCTNMVFSYKIKSKDGAPIKQDLDYTLNFIPGGERSPGMFPPENKKKDEKKKDDKKVAEKK